ncbi:MAG: hypothetical protein AB7N24_21970 [Dehalococcoidia bacterium]
MSKEFRSSLGWVLVWLGVAFIAIALVPRLLRPTPSLNQAVEKSRATGDRLQVVLDRTIIELKGRPKPR